MKKITRLGLILMLGVVLILAACGSNEKSSGSKGEEKKTLKIVTDAAYAPMEYLEGDKAVGFDIDFIKAVAEEAGYEINVVHVGWDPIFVEIEQKTADIGISSITINDERKESYDFSVPYYPSTNKILIPEDSTIESGEDLKDKVIAVQNGTTGQEVAEAILGKNHENIKKFENNNLAIQELLSGGADAVIADNSVIEYYAKMNPDQKLKVIADDSFALEYYGLMFQKGSELVSEFDKAINKIYDSGKYAEIYKEWFGNDPDVENLKAQQ